MELLHAADSAKATRLQQAQQLDLQAEGNIPYLVQEERAAIRGFHQTRLPLVSPRERPLLVTKKLALEERLGEPGAVHGHERLEGAGALRVKGPRDQLFARSRLAEQQCRGGRGSDAGGELEHVQERLGAPHEAAALDAPVDALERRQELEGSRRFDPLGRREDGR